MKKGIRPIVIVAIIIFTLVTFFKVLVKKVALDKEPVKQEFSTFVKNYGTEEYVEGDISSLSWNNYILTDSKCENGTILLWDKETKTISMSTNQSDKCLLYFEEVPKTEDVLDLKVSNDTPTFGKTSCKVGCDEDTLGVYELEDDYGTSYYYRGDVENNYVKFGTNAFGEDMYWRIIRINGDGSMRLIYDGTRLYPNGLVDTDRLLDEASIWNDKDRDGYDNRMLGYMHGSESSLSYNSDLIHNDYATSTNALYNEVDSKIKSVLNTWYEKNIVETGYSEYVSNEVFCNDRSVYEFKIDDSEKSSLGFGNNRTYYGAYKRLDSTNDENKKITPSLKCSNQNDAFDVDNETENEENKNIGNGKNEYPIGLITLDEVVLAGASLNGNINSKYYLYKGYPYWTMSPAYFNEDKAYMYVVGTEENTSLIDYPNGLAPVINLSKETVSLLTGSGVVTFDEEGNVLENDAYKMPKSEEETQE